MTLVVWWVTCLLWSSVFLFIKVGLRDLPPVTFAAARLVLASVILLPLLLVRGIQLPRRAEDWRVIGLAGLLLLGVNYALLFWGAQFIPSGLTAVLSAVTPAFALVFGHFMLRDEPFTWRALGAIAIGVAGVAVISADQLHVAGRQAVLGCAAVTAGAACVAFAYVYVKAHRPAHMRPVVISCAQMVCAAGPMVMFAAIREGSPLDMRWTPAAVVSLLYLAVAGSILAAWLNYWLLERMSATALLSMGLVEPVIAVLLGAVFLHERVTARAGVGGLLVLCSIFMIAISFQRSRT